MRVANANMERAIRVVSVERGPRSARLRARRLRRRRRHARVRDRRGARHRARSSCRGTPACCRRSACCWPTSRATTRRACCGRRRVVAGGSRATRSRRSCAQAGASSARRASAGASRVERALDVRYVGQSYEITVPFAADYPRATFDRRHDRRYGYANPARPTEVVNVRVNAGRASPTSRRSRSRSRRRGHRRRHRPCAAAADSTGERRRRRVLSAGTTSSRAPRRRSGRDRRRRGDGRRAAGLRVRVDGFGNVDRARRQRETGRRELVRSSHRVRGLQEPLRLHRRGDGRHARAARASRPTSRSASTTRAPSSTRDGETIAQGDHMPVHLGRHAAVGARGARRRRRWSRATSSMLNDPFRGGTHLPDITLVSPVFLAGGPRPAFFVANRAHHSDVGGMSPGSMPLAREIYQEGLIIPPVHARAARPDRAATCSRCVLANVRTPDEREGDLTAQIAANRVGARRGSRTLSRRYGAAAASAPYAAALQDYTERVAARRHPRRFPTADTRSRTRSTTTASATGRCTIRVAITIRGDRADVDFTGSRSAGRRAASTPTTPSRCRRASTPSAAWSATTSSTTRALRGRSTVIAPPGHDRQRAAARGGGRRQRRDLAAHRRRRARRARPRAAGARSRPPARAR